MHKGTVVFFTASGATLLEQFAPVWLPKLQRQLYLASNKRLHMLRRSASPQDSCDGSAYTAKGGRDCPLID